MSTDPSQEETIFNAAVELSTPEQRLAYIRRACGADLELLRNVEALLRAYEESGGFLNEPVARGAPFQGTSTIESKTAAVASLAERPGQRIGRYKLLEKIGEGGFGDVWMAEQEEPVRRRVALKIIKLGMDTKEVVARFEAERQALAMMDHPHIAHVFDGGATETGRPYFVMELVRGLPITQYCDEQKLTTDERLELFMEVCQAVQHAHQKGVIHRDLKPSNILVTATDGKAVTKVIDFGVARATAQRLTEKTLFTRFGQMIGTPAYMSPEQAGLGGLDIDTRSDVYSLGVVLYELLTGRTPFDAKQLLEAGYEAILRTIREVEPPRPSTRLQTMLRADLTTTAQRRRIEAPKLIHLVRGDLDWIVMKCLEKDRARRYETANGLARDIQRHLSREPVHAAPASASYRFRRFARRNRVALVIGSGFALVLLSAAVLSTWQAVRASHAERRARTQASRSQQVAGFLKQMLQGVGPSVALGRDTKLLREILDRTAEQVGKVLTQEPEVAAELKSIIGEVYQELGDYPRAEATQREALTLRRQTLGNEQPEVAESLSQLATVLSYEGKLAEAESLARQSLALRKRLFGNDHRATAASLSDLGVILRQGGQLHEAETTQREALAIYKSIGKEHEDMAVAMNNLSQLLQSQAKYAEAETFTREALEMRKRLLSPKHPQLIVSLGDLGVLLRDRGKYTEAESVQREVVKLCKEVLGNEHPNLAVCLNNLAQVLQIQGELSEAEALNREALAMSRKLLGEEHWQVALTLNDLGIVLRDQGKLADAEAALRESVRVWRKNVGEDHPSLTVALNNLAQVLQNQGRFGEAEALVRQVLERRRSGGGLPFATSLNDLGVVLRDQGKAGEADQALSEALVLVKQVLGEEHLSVAAVMFNIARLRGNQARLSEAESMHREVLEMRRRLLQKDHPAIAGSLHYLASVLRERGALGEAEIRNREALEMRRKLRGDVHPDVAASLENVARVLCDQHRSAEAETMARECLAIRDRLTPDDWRAFSARALVAVCLQMQGNLTEAEPIFISAYEGLKQQESTIPADSQGWLKETVEQLVKLYEARKKADEADVWRSKRQ